MEKIIFQAQNGKIEFDSEDDFRRYLNGEKPQLAVSEESGNYKAWFSKPLIN